MDSRPSSAQKQTRRRDDPRYVQRAKDYDDVSPGRETPPPPESPGEGGGGGEEEEMPRSALSIFRANEEEIERRKAAVREKVFAQLGRAEQETKRLAEIREELESMGDPARKEIAAVRRKMDAINRELKPLRHTCIKKEKEYKEAVEAFSGKNKEKAQLVSKLMELISESERVRMRKLEELGKMIDTLR